MDGVATAEDPPLRDGRLPCFRVRPPQRPSHKTNTQDTREALDSQHSTTSCAAYVHYALCNRTMCLIHSLTHSLIHSFFRQSLSAQHGTCKHRESRHSTCAAVSVKTRVVSSFPLDLLGCSFVVVLRLRYAPPGRWQLFLFSVAEYLSLVYVWSLVRVATCSALWSFLDALACVDGRTLPVRAGLGFERGL